MPIVLVLINVHVDQATLKIQVHQLEIVALLIVMVDVRTDNAPHLISVFVMLVTQKPPKEVINVLNGIVVQFTTI